MRKRNCKDIINVLEVTAGYASLLSLKIKIEKARHCSARTEEANSKINGKGLLVANSVSDKFCKTLIGFLFMLNKSAR